MDSRVEILSEELATLPQNQHFEPMTYINRIRILHQEIQSEPDRVVLLSLRKTLLDLCDRQVRQQGGNIEKLRAARRSEDRLLCMHEAMQDDGSIDPNALAYVVQREIDAGRIDDADFLRFAAAGASVLGVDDLKPAAKSSWISRLFGR